MKMFLITPPPLKTHHLSFRPTGCIARTKQQSREIPRLRFIRMTRIAFLALLGTLVSHAAPLQGAGDLVLIEKGKPNAVIVAADGISPSEKTGIKELQKYLLEMSGATVDVQKPGDATDPAQVRLVVGNQTVRELFPDLKLDDLGKEGFVLKTVDNAVIVAGGEQRGTMYACFELLEKLGVRWWAVGATDVPRKETVTLPALDERIIPKIEYRDALYAHKYLDDENNGIVFNIHNRMNGFSYGKVPEKLGGRFWFHKNLVHSHEELMQPVGDLDGRFESHPEYWALRNGKNTKDQVCPSRPEVFEIMKANVIKQLKENPHYEFVVVGQEDNKKFCECETCAALAASEETQGAANLLLANKLGEMVEKEFPGKFVMAPAYQWTRKPPKTLKPHRNVGIVLCSIECDFNRPIEEMSTPENKAFAGDIIEWGKIAPKLYIWDYVTDFDHYLLPFPNLDALIPNIKFFAKHGTKGILEQGSHKGHAAEFSQLRNWVLNKAMWNPDQPDNGQALITEFLNGFYGAAGPFIQKYIDVMHAPGRADPAMEAGCYTRLDGAWLKPDVIASAEAAMREAEQAVADNPVLLSRVQHAHMPVWYVLLKRGTQSKTWAETQAKVGKLDIVEIANQFSKVATDWSMQHIADGEESKGFLEWAKSYAAQASQTPPVPPELKDADPKTYRLIQACQMDTRGRWWVPQEGASDGWVCEIPAPTWTVNHQWSAFDDVVPGRKYKVFIRVKASEPRQEGMAVAAGLHKSEHWDGDRLVPAGPVFRAKQIPASELADGQFHAFEVGEFVAANEANPYNGRFWVGTVKAGDPKVLLDCIWLSEVAN